MKKIISLALVMMLLLTSVFTGFSVFAEDVATEDTATETTTTYVDDLGLTIDDSKVPGTYYATRSHYVNDDSAQGRLFDVGTYPALMIDQNKWLGTAYRVPWIPSVALNAGQTGEGDNALRYGVKGAGYSQYPLIFMMRKPANWGMSIATDTTYTISFDMKLVYGEVSNIYSGMYYSAPTRAYPTNFDCDFADGDAAAPSNRVTYNADGGTTGYTGADISADEWTTLTFTTSTIDYKAQYFFINLVSDNADGGVVLIDNIVIYNNSTDENIFTSDKVSVCTASSDYQYSIPYTNVGSFDSKDVYRDANGLLIDNSMVPGYYYGASPHYINGDVSQGRTYESSITPVTPYGSTSWINIAYRAPWLPSVALNAGAKGVGDNALRYGVKGNSFNQYPLSFMMRKEVNETTTSMTAPIGTYTIKFDVKLVSGNISNIYAGFYSSRPATTAPTTLDCNFTDGDASAPTDRVVLNADGEDTGYQGTDISADEWTTLEFTTTTDYKHQYFFINMDCSNAEGGVVLLDNIQIWNEDNENIFTKENVQVSSLTSTYRESVSYENIGNFDDTTLLDDVLGLKIDNSLIPGYYLAEQPYYVENNAENGRLWNNSSTSCRNGNNGWYKNVNWLPAIAVDAGKNGEGDNALRYGALDTIIGQYAIKFLGRNANDGLTIPENGTYTVQFDVKLVAGTLTHLYGGLAHTLPSATVPTNTTCEFTDNMDRKNYNNKGDLTGYTGDDISADEWTTLTFTTTTSAVNYFIYFNLVSESSDGCVILLDNIKLIDSTGANLFTSNNFSVNRWSSSEYDYEHNWYNIGSFNDEVETFKFDNTPTNDTVIPASKIGYREGVAPVVAEGQGVNGTTAMSVTVNSKKVGRTLFQGTSTLDLYNDTFTLNFKAKVAAGNLAAISFGIAENSIYGKTAEQVEEIKARYPEATTEYWELEEEGGTTYKWPKREAYSAGLTPLQISDEWNSYSVTLDGGIIPGSWKQLVINILGKDTECTVLFDDVQLFNSSGKQINIDDEWDISGSFDEMIVPYAVNSDCTVAMSKVERNVAEFIELLNLKVGYKGAALKNTYGVYRGDEKLADDAAIATGDVFKIILNEDGSEYRTLEIALKYDVNGDAEIDARDIVCAKKAVALTSDLSDAQLMAAGVAEGEVITITEVATIRAKFMK